MVIINPTPNDTPESLGVQPGWFVRHGSCSIWFEVIDVVAGRWVTCVARDPKKGTEMVSIGNFFSSITAFATACPGGSWIAKYRKKSFYDKFYPELDRIVPYSPAA